VSRQIVPVLCGSSKRNKGVQPLLDAVVDYLPSPLDMPPVTATDPESGEIIVSAADDEAPLLALVFKIQTDPYGKLSFVRIYSGSLEAGKTVYNATKMRRERIGRLVKMHANCRKDISAAFSGEIPAIIGLKESVTGDTLCDETRPLLLGQMEFSEPVISSAIEPKTKDDQDRLGIALHRLAEEDPTFRTFVDVETGQTLISGMGELHLEIIMDRLQREFNVNAVIGQPQVAYKETITRPAKAEGKFVKQSGGHGQYGHVVLELEPLTSGEGYKFVDKTTGGSIPKEYMSAIDSGIKEAMQKGMVSGSPMMDIQATVIDGSYHDVDSSEIAFKLAASMAFHSAASKAIPVVLEPVMKIEVVMPQEYMGDVIGDLNSRRGRIEETEQRNNLQIVRGLVPLESMCGYATTLRSITQGRGSSTMQFFKYDQAPAHIVEELGRQGSKIA
jgi:elongation factor G